MAERDLLSGLVRLHILHHAAHEPIFGLGIIEELGRHGYKLSAGTLYPILHGLEKSGCLASRPELVAGRQRRLYVITDAGQAVLALAKTKVWELFRELFEDELRFGAGGRVDQGEAARLAGASSAREGGKARPRKGKESA
jgi:DNA-binding PadR family transcriptional regulator